MANRGKVKRLVRRMGVAFGAGIWLGGLVLWGQPGAELRGVDSGVRIQVADTETRIKIAKVFLSIGELLVDGEHLVGNYSIDVPLLPKKSEGGSIRLNLTQSLESLMTEGGVLKGQGLSFKENLEPRSIVCKVMPSETEARAGRIELLINTGGRELTFESEYAIVGGEAGEPLALMVR